MCKLIFWLLLLYRAVIPKVMAYEAETLQEIIFGFVDYYPINRRMKKLVHIYYTLFMTKKTAGTGMSHTFLLKN